MFGSLAYYLDRDNRRKLDRKGKKSKFIVYDEESKAYLLIDLETRRVMQARSVPFNKNIILDDFKVDSEPLKTAELSIEGCIELILSNQALRKPTRHRANWWWYWRFNGGATEENQVEDGAVGSHSTDHQVQRSVRTRNPPFLYGLVYTHASLSGIQEPKGYPEAVYGSEKEQLLAAMAFDVKSPDALGTWTLVDRPRSRKMIDLDGFLL